MIYFYKDIMVLYGKHQNNTKHKHFATQIIISSSPLLINNDIYPHAVVIKGNVPHYARSETLCLSLLIDPHSYIGQYLSTTLDYADIAPLQNIPDYHLFDIMDTPITKSSVEHIINTLYMKANQVHRIDDRIQKVVEIIRQTSGIDIELSNLAKECYLSESRFAHLFKSEIGLSVMRYVSWIKIINATAQLVSEYSSKDQVTKNTTISQVAHDFDFADDAHFCRIFRSTFGVNIKKILNVLVKK